MTPSCTRIVFTLCFLLFVCGSSQAQRNSIFSKKPSKLFSNKPAPTKAKKTAKVVKPKAEKPAKVVKPKAEKTAKVVKPKAEKTAKVVKPKAEKTTKVVKPKAEKTAKVVEPKAEKPVKVAKPKVVKPKATVEKEKAPVPTVAKATAPTKTEVSRPPYSRKCEGDCLNGVGIGYFSHDSTTVYYDGEWKNGDKEGQGMLFYPSGNPKYNGQFSADLENGEGTKYQDNSGMILYEGEWKHGMPNGLGTLYFSNGDSHEGNFTSGKKNGEGAYTFADGTVLAGVWKHNVLVGKGTLTKNGTDVEQHLPQQGKNQTRCQSPYDCKNGYGVFVYDDGRRYEGEYKDSQYHGQGKFFNAQGILIYEGSWSNHQRSGQGISYRGNDGEMEYEGSFDSNKRNGYGVSYHPATNTPLYKGDWADGMFYGEGVLLNKKGRVVFRGTWKNGYMIEERNIGSVSEPQY